MADLDDFIDPDMLADYLDNDDEVINEKLAVAQDAADYARSIAPQDTGEYVDGIVVEQSGTTVSVGFTDPKSHLIEFGTVDTPEFGIRAKMEAKFQGDFE